jgi:MFS family permease
VLYTGPGTGALIGAPTAGYVIDHSGSYRWAIVGCLVVSALANLALIGLPADGEGRLVRADDAIG